MVVLLQKGVLVSVTVLHITHMKPRLVMFRPCQKKDQRIKVPLSLAQYKYMVKDKLHQQLHFG